MGGLVLPIVCVGTALLPAQEEPAPPKLRLLIVTGGHGFDRDAFSAIFDSFAGVEWREVTHPDANDSYAPEVAETYDALLLYDMNQEITEEQKAAFVALLNGGKGLVVLHHALANYQEWDEFEKIAGGRYHTQPYTRDGKQHPASTYRHGVDISVHVADPDHPVTAGLEDFTIHDEVYGGFSVQPTVHALLTTDHPESSETLAWTNEYGKSRIVTIQLGHDAHAYENPNYRKLVQQAIRWVAAELQ
jgi:type 1 glutamine amidotransferase